MYSQPLTQWLTFVIMRLQITKRSVPLCVRCDMRILNDDILEKVAQYNIDYQKEHGRSPSYREIMHALKLGSLATVQRYVRALVKADRIEVTNAGNISPLPQFVGGESKVVPLIGEIACGEPLFAVENIEESYTLPKSLFGDGELFMLTAKGNSMIDAGISKGDFLVIRRQTAADDGDIVVALIDNDATLKRLYHKDGKIILHPENKQMNDIVLDKCNVQGVLVGCIKKY